MTIAFFRSRWWLPIGLGACATIGACVGEVPDSYEDEERRSDSVSADGPQAAPLVADGIYEIKSALSGLCVDVSGATVDNGGRIVQSPCSGANNQRSRLTVQSDGRYTVSPVHSAKCW